MTLQIYIFLKLKNLKWINTEAKINISVEGFGVFCLFVFCILGKLDRDERTNELEDIRRIYPEKNKTKQSKRMKNTEGRLRQI